MLDPTAPAATSPPAARRRWTAPLTVVALVCLLAAGRYFDLPDLLRHLLAWIAGLGPWGPALFVVAYVLAAVLFIPGSVLTLGAGALFGVVVGSLAVSLGSTLGATSAFVIGRYLARDAALRRLADDARFVAIDRAVAREGWKIVGLTRLSPLLPFSLLNYAFGLTSVSLRHFVLASWIGMMPGTVMYVYFGSLVRVGADPGGRRPLEWLLYGVGLLATVAASVFVARLARAALAERIGG